MDNIITILHVKRIRANALTLTRFLLLCLICAHRRRLINLLRKEFLSCVTNERQKFTKERRACMKEGDVIKSSNKKKKKDEQKKASRTHNDKRHTSKREGD